MTEPLLQDHLSRAADLVEQILDELLPDAGDLESRLVAAMRYAALGGGKRLRPFLTLSSARLFGVSEESALRVAAAVECVHCYSLVHDDLPAMDDDPVRRGKPTTHVAFDEATAILAGDALLTLAFEILADGQTHSDPKVRCELVAELARAAGARGMCGGQMLDIAAQKETFDIGTVTRLQRLKTGELIAFACVAGAILGRADPAAMRALHGYAHDLGLAFQITDDLLDVEGRHDDIGKGTGKDDRAGKATFVSILGTERARQQAELLVGQAVAHLALFESRAEPLRLVSRFVIDRQS